jgi:hypothetical protein
MAVQQPTDYTSRRFRGYVYKTNNQGLFCPTVPGFDFLNVPLRIYFNVDLFKGVTIRGKSFTARFHDTEVDSWYHANEITTTTGKVKNMFILLYYWPDDTGVNLFLIDSAVPHTSHIEAFIKDFINSLS